MRMRSLLLLAVLLGLAVMLPAQAVVRETVVAKEIHFALDSATLTAEARSVLDEIVAVLNAHPTASATVIGHTCDIADNPYNERLAARRAVAAEHYLAEKGITDDRLNIGSRGEEQPKYDNSDPAQKAMNRRVEIRLTLREEIPAPVVTLSANPAVITRGQSTTLTWTSANATAVSIAPAPGAVATGGDRVVSPTASTTYTAKATGEGGEAMASASVQVVAPRPTVSIKADPATIVRGQSTTLTWSSTDATVVTVSPALGSVATSGNRPVSPAAAVTYTARAVGDGGEATASTLVNVTEPPETLRTAFANVVDAKGAFITDLGPGSFAITEDGKAREIVSVTYESLGRASGIALVLDKSASLGSAIRDLKRAAIAFVEEKKPEDQILTIAFSSDVVTLRDFDTDKDAIVSAINRLNSFGTTKLYDALFTASGKMSAVTPPRIVVLMTDGVDESGFGARGSVKSLDEAIAAARDAGVAVYVIGLGSKLDRDILTRIAAETNGHAYFTTDPAELQAIYRQLSVGLLRGQYRIVYRSTPDASGKATVTSSTGRVVGSN